MNWLKKLKKSIVTKEQQTHEKQVLDRYRTGGLAKQCMECRHFTYRVEKPRNWVCRCPDAEMRFIGNTCLGFKYGAHPEMIVYSSR